VKLIIINIIINKLIANKIFNNKLAKKGLNLKKNPKYYNYIYYYNIKEEVDILTYYYNINRA